MNTIYIVCLEPIDHRYTKQWYDNIPDLITKQASINYIIKTIDGIAIDNTTTTGAFLDFGATNAYKASQIQTISNLFSNGTIKNGDRFLVTDAWNFAITAIKYMSDLLDVDIEIHGIWHAGAYDPTDILGLKMEKPWCNFQEMAWFHACDYNYFATNFHKDMFLNNLNIPDKHKHKAIRSGQPYDYLVKELSKTYGQPRVGQNRLVWPHRKNQDKQPNIINSLVQPLYKQGIDVLITQDYTLSKQEYYNALGDCKVNFSCSLHENLGTSIMEGCFAGVLPLVPDRASYSEMYMDEFKYPSEWTESYDAFQKNKGALLAIISDFINNYELYKKNFLWKQVEILKRDYITADIMMGKLTS